MTGVFLLVFLATALLVRAFLRAMASRVTPSAPVKTPPPRATPSPRSLRPRNLLGDMDRAAGASPAPQTARRSPLAARRRPSPPAPFGSPIELEAFGSPVHTHPM